MRRGLLPGSTAITFRSSIVPWQPRMLCTWCVSKLTCSFGLDRFSSSKIHCRAAPIESGAFGSEQVLRVLKLESFCSSVRSRASETDDTSFSMRGSTVCACTGALVKMAPRMAPAQTALSESLRTFRTLAPSYPSSSFVSFMPLSNLCVFEIIARGNAQRLPQRRIVEVHPRLRVRAVGQRDVRFRSGVKASVGIVVAVALDVVERGEHAHRLGHLVDFPPDAPFRRRDGRRIEPQIEQRAVDRPAADVAQLVVDAGTPSPVETRHQRAVEKDEIPHESEKRSTSAGCSGLRLRERATRASVYGGPGDEVPRKKEGPLLRKRPF